MSTYGGYPQSDQPTTGYNVQQQQMLQRQQPGYRPQQPPPPPQQSIDLQDSIRSAKRYKPTDRSLPSFVPVNSPTHPSPTEKRLQASTEALQSLAASYQQLQQVERQLDWNVSRRKVEIAETLGPARASGVKRTLRVHLSTTVLDQPWQLGDKLKDVPAPPDSDKPGTGTINAQQAGEQAVAAAQGGQEEEGDATQVKPDFVTGRGVPKFELKVTGELLGDDEHKKPLTGYVTRVVVETDRDPTLYDKTGPLDWHRSSSTIPPPAGLSMSFRSSSTTKLRLSLYLDHRPERFALAPRLASLLDLRESDRVGVLQALWSYIKMHGLQDEDRKHIRTDARLKEIFGQQEKIPFHHLPEYLNRLLAPASPVVLEHAIRVDAEAGASQHVAFDVEVTVEDPVRSAMERVSDVLNSPNEAMKEIIAFDEKIALDASAARAAHLKRTFLTAFASSPTSFISKWLASQAKDLDLILGRERGSTAAVGGGAGWREEARRAESWQGGWVKEGAEVLSSRRQERGLREAMAGQLGQQQQQQQQQQQRAPVGMGYAPPMQQGFGTPQGYPGRR